MHVSIVSSWYHNRFQDKVFHIFVHTLLPVTGRLQGAAYLVCGTYFNGARLRLTRSFQHMREDMCTTLMEVALEWIWDVELYILHNWDFRGLLIYCLWASTLTLLKKISLLQIMFTFTIDLDVMLLDYYTYKPDQNGHRYADDILKFLLLRK